jgi:hypothetical protein
VSCGRLSEHAVEENDTVLDSNLTSSPGLRNSPRGMPTPAAMLAFSPMFYSMAF